MEKNNQITAMDVEEKIGKQLRSIQRIMRRYDRECVYWSACFINGSFMFNTDPDVVDKSKRIDFMVNA